MALTLITTAACDTGADGPLPEEELTAYQVCEQADDCMLITNDVIGCCDQGALRNPAAYRDDQGPYKPMVPYYLLLRLPGEEDLSFIILQPFTPASKNNMIDSRKFCL